MASFAGWTGSNVGLPGHYRGRHILVSAKLAEKVGVAISMS